MEDHCGKAGRSKINRLLAKQTRLFSYIEGLQAETRVYYTLWQCGPELRILVSGEAGPAVRCTFPADMECRARNLLQYLYENTVMPSQAADEHLNRMRSKKLRKNVKMRRGTVCDALPR